MPAPAYSWGRESRDYHICVDVTPGGSGDEMLAARVSVVEGDTVHAQCLVRAVWTDDTALSTRINRQVAHYTGQAELAEAIQAGLAAREAPAAGDTAPGPDVGGVGRAGSAPRSAITQREPRELDERLDILRAGGADHVVRQRRAGRSLGEADLLEIVAHEVREILSEIGLPRQCTTTWHGPCSPTSPWSRSVEGVPK